MIAGTQIMGRTEEHMIDDWVQERKGIQAEEIDLIVNMKTWETVKLQK